MSRKFFISDTHFGHANILKYENRPFASVEEMDRKMIKNWNSVVGRNDDVFILGDFSFHRDPQKTLSILKQLHGRKHLILGNHDYEILSNSQLREQFVWVKDYYVLRSGGKKYVLFHFPIQVWDCRHHGAIHLFGHVHGNKNTHHVMAYDLPNSLNVGVDVHNFTPISLSEVDTLVQEKNVALGYGDVTDWHMNSVGEIK